MEVVFGGRADPQNDLLVSIARQPVSYILLLSAINSFCILMNPMRLLHYIFLVTLFLLYYDNTSKYDDIAMYVKKEYWLVAAEEIEGRAAPADPPSPNMDHAEIIIIVMIKMIGPYDL